MTDDAEKKEKKVRKVGTGAWWKSTKIKKEVPAPLSQAEQEQTKESARLEASPPEPQPEFQPEVKPPRPPRKRGRKKAAPVQEDQSSTEPEPSAPENPVLEEGQRVDQPVKEKSKRPKKRRAKRSSTVEEEVVVVAEDPEDEDAPVEDEEQVQERKPSARLLINAEEPEECRIALIENGRLESYHVTTSVRERTKNNIYKGKIVSVEANLQAAFVEIGTGRNGFLPFTDIHPEYYKEDLSEQSRNLIRQQQWRKLKIEEVISRGQEVLVQVVKEVTGNKGANMTTYLSLPGRCLVLMPGSDSSGISRKISSEKQRSELREIMANLNMPEGIGYIVRTASVDADITKAALEEDLTYLLGLWNEIKQRGQSSPSPSLIYEDQDTVIRFLRDHFVPEIEEIVVDTQESYDQVTQFIEHLPARKKKVRVKLHRGAKPIFNQNNIEEQIESIYQPQVSLPSGGSIVIDPTEALVAIDVNSGRTSQKGDFDKSIFLANMEAAEELARQLRLRDLGGLIVVDFIDMRNSSHIKEVEKKVKQSMKRDKAKVDISRISRFGLMQISRQKMGSPIEKGSYCRCEHCEGRGLIRSVETLSLYYLRRIQTGVSRKKIRKVEARLPLEISHYLLNKKREEIMELESKHEAFIDIIPCPEMKPGENKIEFLV